MGVQGVLCLSGFLDALEIASLEELCMEPDNIIPLA
jgi:hypothetical protein